MGLVGRVLFRTTGEERRTFAFRRPVVRPPPPGPETTIIDIRARKSLLFPAFVLRPHEFLALVRPYDDDISPVTPTTLTAPSGDRRSPARIVKIHGTAWRRPNVIDNLHVPNSTVCRVHFFSPLRVPPATVSAGPPPPIILFLGSRPFAFRRRIRSTGQ